MDGEAEPPSSTSVRQEHAPAMTAGQSKWSTVQLDAEGFDRPPRPTVPRAGVVELIWNALDTDHSQ